MFRYLLFVVINEFVKIIISHHGHYTEPPTGRYVKHSIEHAVFAWVSNDQSEQ